MEVKAVKEDNQFILARMQNLSKDDSYVEEEINHEKQIQSNMIRQFEQGKSGNKMTVNELSKEKNEN